jgi:hypothetical protein
MIILLFFLINELGWSHLSILINKKRIKKYIDACCGSVSALVVLLF